MLIAGIITTIISILMSIFPHFFTKLKIKETTL